MKSILPGNITPSNSSSGSFFPKENNNNFFGQTIKPFFNPSSIQAKLNVNQPNDKYEQDADAMADKVVQRLPVPSTNGDSSNNASNLSIQRKCAACEHEEEEKIQKKESDAPANTATTLPQAATTTPTAGVARFIVDDNVTPGAGQMRKTDILNRLREEIFVTVNEALAGTPYSSDNCPYIRASFARHQNSSPAQIEALINRYCPSAAQAQSAEGIIQQMKQKVYAAAKQWANNGGNLAEAAQIFGGMTTGIGSAISGITSSIGGIASSIGGFFFKANEGGVNTTQSPQSVMQSLGKGQSLDSSSKGKMESAFGTSFSNVEVHTGSNAANLSANMNARAFAVGNHIAFGSGEHKPGTIEGDSLMAHELAHVEQQKNMKGTKSSSERDLELDVDDSMFNSVGESKSAKRISPKLKSGLRISRCPKPAKKPLLDQFAEKFPDSIDVIKSSPSALVLVKEASDAGVEFGGYAEDGPLKSAWAYTSGKVVYVPKSRKADKLLGANSFLFELNNGIRASQFHTLGEEAGKGSKGTLDAKSFARKMVELEVEGMLRLGEVWLDMKKNAPKGENWDKYDTDFYLAEYKDYQAGKKTKDDIVKSVLAGVYPAGVNQGKTIEQNYMEQYKLISGGK